MMADDAHKRPIRRGMLARARGVWVITAVAAIAVGVWIASFWFHAAWINPNGMLVGVANGDFYEVSFPAANLVRAVPSGGEAIVAKHGTPLWWSGYFGGPPLTVTTTSIALHWWALGIAAAWWGLIWWRLRHLREPHECWQCAYDRRGLAREMACPECGAPARAPTSV